MTNQKSTSEQERVEQTKKQTQGQTPSTDVAEEATVAFESAVFGALVPEETPSPTSDKEVSEDELLGFTDEGNVVVALTVAYNGGAFSGFAKQPGQLTVQGSLEDALKTVYRHKVETTCAGRTDAGVHAIGQVVSFELPPQEWEERTPKKLVKSLNALTHGSVTVRSAERKKADFSARFSAVSRTYRYFISTASANPLLMNGFSWHLGKKPDVEAMREASQYLLGEHDFKSFCKAESAKDKPTHRNIIEISFDECSIWNDDMLVITVVGNAFLHSMVRTLVGTLISIGNGLHEPAWIKEVLEARDRTAAGENAPACGLVFWSVDYEGERVYVPDAFPQAANVGFEKLHAEAEAEAAAAAEAEAAAAAAVAEMNDYAVYRDPDAVTLTGAQAQAVIQAVQAAQAAKEAGFALLTDEEAVQAALDSLSVPDRMHQPVQQMNPLGQTKPMQPVVDANYSEPAGAHPAFHEMAESEEPDYVVGDYEDVLRFWEGPEGQQTDDEKDKGLFGKLFGRKKTGFEHEERFVIPRGTGEIEMTGSVFSEVNHLEEDENGHHYVFDASQATGSMPRVHDDADHPETHPEPKRVDPAQTEQGVFGEVAWDEDLDNALDEAGNPLGTKSLTAGDSAESATEDASTEALAETSEKTEK